MTNINSRAEHILYPTFNHHLSHVWTVWFGMMTMTNTILLFPLTMAANLVKSMLPLASRKPGSWAPATPFCSLPPPRPPAKPWAGNPNGKPGKPPPGPGKPAAERSEAGQGQLSPGSGPRPESREAVPLPRWPASKQIALCLISTLSPSHDIMCQAILHAAFRAEPSTTF